MFRTDPLAEKRYKKNKEIRALRLNMAMTLQPDTGHKPGHKYGA